MISDWKQLIEVRARPVPGGWVSSYLDSEEGHPVLSRQRYGPDFPAIRSFPIRERVTPSTQQPFVRYANHARDFTTDLVKSLAQRRSNLVEVEHC
jgi:hypothetical protein